MGAAQRWRHPELAELHIEGRNIDLAIAKALKRDSNCVDVGCHIGSILSQFLKFAPQGHHIAVEASVEKSRILARRFPHVEVHQTAVADYIGTADFVEGIAQSANSQLASNDENGDDNSRVGADRVVYQVGVTTLDAIIGERNVDFVKLDIEGGSWRRFGGFARR
jgi:FkbM family methyltransferase